MTNMLRSVTSVGIVLVLASPAAAQEPEWVSRLEKRIEAHARVLAQVLAFEDAQRGLRGRRDPARFGPEVTERFSRTVRLGRNGALDLSNVAGDIVVTGVGGDDVRIEAVKRTRNRDEAAGRANLQAVTIEVRELDGRVEVRTEPSRDLNQVAVDFTITVPQDARVMVRNTSGTVRTTNIGGDLRAETVRGTIEVRAAQRLRALKTVSGDVEIAESETDGTVTVTTVSGDQVIRGLKARGIELGSVSGDMTLTDVEIERVTVRTLNGDVQYDGPLARNGRYEVITHAGEIALAVDTAGFDVNARTFSGDFRSDYDLTLGGGDAAGRRRRGGPGPAIRGRFGDGGASLSLRSFSGDIAITRR